MPTTAGASPTPTCANSTRPLPTTRRLSGLGPQGTTALFYGRAFASGQKGEFDKAIADYTKAIRLDPEVATMLTPIAACLPTEGPPDTAIADYTEAIRINPKDDWAYNNRGNAYRKARARQGHCRLYRRPSGSIRNTFRP